MSARSASEWPKIEKQILTIEYLYRVSLAHPTNDSGRNWVCKVVLEDRLAVLSAFTRTNYPWPFVPRSGRAFLTSFQQRGPTWPSFTGREGPVITLFCHFFLIQNFGALQQIIIITKKVGWWKRYPQVLDKLRDSDIMPYTYPTAILHRCLEVFDLQFTTVTIVLITMSPSVKFSSAPLLFRVFDVIAHLSPLGKTIKLCHGITRRAFHFLLVSHCCFHKKCTWRIIS